MDAVLTSVAKTWTTWIKGLAVSRDCRTQLKAPGSCVADRLHEVE